MKGPAGKDDSFHPVTSLGATYAVTKNVFVNAEMFTSFARYKGTVEARGDDYVLKPMATDFTLSLGVAFCRRTNPSRTQHPLTVRSDCFGKIHCFF